MRHFFVVVVHLLAAVRVANVEERKLLVAVPLLHRRPRMQLPSLRLQNQN